MNRILTDYRYNIFTIHTIVKQIVWNQRHGLPELNLPEQLQELKKDIMLFENILEQIQDRRTRIVLSCRFALGWSWPIIADFLEMSQGTVMTIAAEAMDRLPQTESWPRDRDERDP